MPAPKPGLRLLFIGDSITDAGRRHAGSPLGNGYVQLVADKLMDPPCT